MVSIAGNIRPVGSSVKTTTAAPVSTGLIPESTSARIASIPVSTVNGNARMTSAQNLAQASSASLENKLRRAADQNAAYLEEAKALYEPYAETGAKSLDEYTKLLLGGVDGLSEDQNFQNLQNLAERKVMSNRAVSGLLRSGATASALDDTLLRFANDYYGSRLGQLKEGVGIGATATASKDALLQKLGGNTTDLASALANIQMQRESNDAMIKAAQAQAGATTSAAKAQGKSDMWGAIAGGLATGAILALSDRRMKTDLRLVGKSENGLNIYLGKYKPESGLDDGKEHLFLIAQEVKDVVPEAVVEGDDGFLRVDYAKALGV